MLFHPPNKQILSHGPPMNLLRTEPEPNPNLKFFFIHRTRTEPELRFLKINRTEPNPNLQNRYEPGLYSLVLSYSAFGLGTW